MIKDDAKAGALDDNSLRCDIEEVTDYISIDFILNVVLDEKKEIINAVAGHHKEAHREGCKYLDRLYKVKIDKLADIVIVSPGGFPKDINVYQAQKALDNAKHAVKEDGIIIWVASCNEGLGEDVFERWINEADSPEALIDRVRTNFELGGHKAAAIAMVLQKARVFLVSDLDKDYVRNAFLEPYDTLDEAVNQALKIMGSNSGILVMPYGGSTLPVIKIHK
jgi:nickel-dependent lactate racemase